MNAIAARIRSVLTLRRAVVFAPYAIVVATCAIALLGWHAPEYPTEIHRYVWRSGYLSFLELCALNVSFPATFLFIVGMRLWGSLALQIPPWREMRWLQRTLLVGLLIGSLIFLASVFAHGGRWPVSGQ